MSPLRALCALSLVALIGCGDESGPESASPGDTDSGPAPVPVALHTLESGRAQAVVKAWGTVAPLREASILAEVTGTVARVNAGLGELVTEGHVLLEIDPALYRARLREAESLEESAEIGRRKAKKDLERAEGLFDRGTLSDSELEGSRSRAAEAAAALWRAKAAVEDARKRLASAVLKAPFTGRVGSRPPDPGSTVNLGAPLVTLVDIERVRVTAAVSEQDLPRIRLGDAAGLRVQGIPRSGFEGRVTAIGPVADPETRQYPVEITVENPDAVLKGGMVARVEVVYEVYENTPLLPLDALVETDQGSIFYVVDGNVAQQRIARVGPRVGDRVALLEGAAAGERVVVLGQTRLGDGSPVTVDKEVP